MTNTGGQHEKPTYDTHGLLGVLPSVAHSLNVPGFSEWDTDLPQARSAVVVLVDGLGDELLRRRSGHAPFLRSLLNNGRRLHAGFPSTTATSLTSLGTGLPPGAHGMIGYEGHNPDNNQRFNALSWENGPDPELWQPFPTVFEKVAPHLEPFSIGPTHFEGSGLTRASLRGPRYNPADDLDDRIDAAVTILRTHPRALIYLYWGEVDKVGHEHGCGSWQWGDELERIDAALRQLARRVPTGTAIHITADHGMIDTNDSTRFDIGLRPAMTTNISHVTGDPRAPHLHLKPGTSADTAATWSAELGHRGTVLTREQAIETGVFGPVRDEVAARIGDLIVIMNDNHVILDSRRDKPGLLRLVGHHGSTTVDELAVPLLSLPPR
ncbi:phosphonoacetate hydrolase [Dermatophilus congolensis]|uniref:Phosphonoacetate hydrolase n=1 Tax=Dermatophilus congolensis TaxID=1863 RepID=A0AA46BNB6_9MICO|nr:nucleotide pyrophosphatase/phosphodiesterase family protein [Dermatophilus congolensis]STD09506.1 phosphonoacetate hydrolase [Dermatophilus congolensis]